MTMTPRKRATVNAVGIMLSRGVTFAIGIFLVPFMIGRLGQEDYGIFQLVRSLRNFLPLLSLAVGPALARYVTHALGRNDRIAICRYMSTGLFAFTVLALVILLAGVGVSWVLPNLIDLGDQAVESQVLLFLLVAAFSVSYVSSLMGAPLFATERLAESSALDAFGEVVRAVIIVIAFVWISPNLIWVGIGSLAATLASGCALTISAFIVAPWLRLSWSRFEWSALRELLSFSFFSTIGVLVQAIFFSTDNLLIKWLFGADALVLITVYSVAAGWYPWLQSGIAPVLRVLMPRVTLLTAQDQRESVRRVVLTAIRYAAALSVGVCLFLAVFAEALLHVWLGDRLTPEQNRLASQLMLIFLVPLSIDLALRPVHSVFVAEAKIAWPSLSNLAAALLNLVLSVVLVRYAGWGLYGIAAGTGISMILRLTMFLPIYFLHVSGISLRRFIREAVWRPAILAVIFLGVCGGIRISYRPSGVVGLGIVGLVCVLLYAIGAWCIVAYPDDRRRIMGVIRRR